MATTKRIDVQWLRALAAIEVVVWHSDLVTKHFSGYVIQQSSYAPFGGIGVELFFVISGFIIGGRASTYQSAVTFLRARCVRIVPLYLLFSTAAMAGYILFVREWPDLLIALKSYLVLPQRNLPVLGVGWTLEHEMLFYGAVTILIGIGGQRRQVARFAFGILMGGLAGVGFWLGTGPKPIVWDYHLFSPYWLAFSIGWLASVIEQAVDPALRRWMVASIALGILAIAILPMMPQERGLLWRILTAATLFSCHALLPRFLTADNWLGRMGSRIGDTSYSLYLSHIFVLSIVGKLLGRAGLPVSLDWAVRMAAVLLCICVGVLVYERLERPLVRMLRRGNSADRPESPSVAVAAGP